MIVRIVPCVILFFKGIGLSLIYIAEAGNIIGVHIQHRLLCILGGGNRRRCIFIILADAQEYCRQHHQCQQHSDHLSLFLFHNNTLTFLSSFSVLMLIALFCSNRFYLIRLPNQITNPAIIQPTGRITVTSNPNNRICAESTTRLETS